ncbi:MAG: hypothetical protein HY508_12975 [Acidobacteria bacterium]|nr:hypothetical protein [Acidobacteriota bacterium]
MLDHHAALRGGEILAGGRAFCAVTVSQPLIHISLIIIAWEKSCISFSKGGAKRMPSDKIEITKLVVSVVQLVVVTGTLLYTARRVDWAAEATQTAARGVQVSADAAKAAMLERLAAGSRELQLKTISDKDLAPLLFGEAKSTPQSKRSVMIGMVINHYALVFDLNDLGHIPKQTWDAFVADMTSFFGNPQVQRRWDQVKSQHGTRFRNFVEHELLRRTSGG